MGRRIVELLKGAGMEPTIGAMLLVIVSGMILKSLTLLLANRQVGFTVAHVATALRLEPIDALLGSRWQYYLRQPMGSLANSVATEAYRAANGFEHGVIVLALVVQIIVYGTVAMFISWEATAYLLPDRDRHPSTPAPVNPSDRASRHQADSAVTPASDLSLGCARFGEIAESHGTGQGRRCHLARSDQTDREGNEARSHGARSPHSIAGAHTGHHHGFGALCSSGTVGVFPALR